MRPLRCRYPSLRAQVGRLTAALILAAVTAFPSGAAGAGDAAVVPTIRVDGPITVAVADYVDRTLGSAEEAQAEAFLIQLDTPGGDAGSMQTIAGRLLNATVPTVVWVGPQGAQAASAGTFLVLAAHAAGMAPRTTIGAASPVGSGGEDLPETLGRKATEDLAAAARNFAQRRGERASAWAERAVRQAASLTADEALELGVIDAVASSPAELLEALDGQEVTVADQPVTLHTTGATLTEEPMSWAERLLALLTHPAVALLLLTIGVNAILIELSHPGGFMAGTVGVIALILGLYSLGALDANMVGLVFIAAAFALFVLDIKAPTHGLLTAAGVGLFILGAATLFSGTDYAVPWATIGALALGTAIFFFFVVRAAVKALRRPATTGMEGLIGAEAEVRQALAPHGMVLVRGELWDARSVDDTPLPAGASARVVGRHGYTLLVRSEAAPPAPGGPPPSSGPPAEPPAPPATGAEG
jgi:membrane-bound serine protease (ClpP class)